MGRETPENALRRGINLKELFGQDMVDQIEDVKDHSQYKELRAKFLEKTKEADRL